eukprot:m51a1_g10064 putative protein kinase (795) ;mRNA; f:87381-90226
MSDQVRTYSFPSNRVRPELSAHGFASVDGGAWAQRDASMLAAEGPRQNHVRAMTNDLVHTYKKCDPAFEYKAWKPPRRPLTDPSVPRHNNSLDNEHHDLILHVGDVLSGESSEYCWKQGTRYTIIDMLGKGTFGQVVKCRDEEERKLVAVKVLKSKPDYFRQGLLEIGVCTAVNTNLDRDGERNTLRIVDHFLYHGHLCIVSELLSMDLFELLKQNRFKGVSIRLIRTFVRQILQALSAMAEGNIVHCDLKPENILLQNLKDLKIKVIDYGSACFASNTMYSYIQSRHYRSPEVLLGMPYSCAIDMWSLGCIAAELFLGIPLFPGSHRYNQVYKIVELLGIPPKEMIELGSNSSKYFKPMFSPFTGEISYSLKSETEYERENDVKLSPNRQYFAYRTLHDLVHKYPMRTGAPGLDARTEEAMLRESRRSFEHFLLGVLQYDPSRRWTPDQALAHPFLQEDFTPLPPDWRPPVPARVPYVPSSRPSYAPAYQMRTIEDFCTNYSKFVASLRECRVIDVTNGNVLAVLNSELIPAPGLIGSRRGGWGAPPAISSSLPGSGMTFVSTARKEEPTSSRKPSHGLTGSMFRQLKEVASSYIEHHGPPLAPPQAARVPELPPAPTMKVFPSSAARAAPPAAAASGTFARSAAIAIPAKPKKEPEPPQEDSGMMSPPRWGGAGNAAASSSIGAGSAQFPSLSESVTNGNGGSLLGLAAAATNGAPVPGLGLMRSMAHLQDGLTGMSAPQKSFLADAADALPPNSIQQTPLNGIGLLSVSGVPLGRLASQAQNGGDLPPFSP